MAPKKGERKGISAPAKTSEDADVDGMSRRGVLEELEGLLARAHDGDKKCLSRLREILDAAPQLARKFVDPAQQAELSMIRNYAGEDLLAKEAIPRTLKAMRAELAGPDPSPLEQLLVERVVATWFQLQYFEALYAQSIDELTMTQGDHHQKRIDRTHRRHLSAIRTLAQIRKRGPAASLQINIAEKQINTPG